MTSELTKALCAFHQNVGTIKKTSKSYTNQYAPLEEVLSVVTPALSAQGLTVTHTFQPLPESDQPLLVCTLRHTSGESIESMLPLVVPKGKNPAQDLGSAITYGRRYTLLAIIGLTADVDTDGNVSGPQPETKSEPAPTPKPKAAKPKAEPVDPPLSDEDRTTLLDMLRVLPKPGLTAVVDAFNAQFGHPAGTKIVNLITTQAHADFLKPLILEHEGANNQ